MSRKLVFMVTHGPDDPERATIPFAMAVAAQSAGIEVVMGFQVEGALLLKKGVADSIAAIGFVPLKELIDIYRAGGGKFYACGPCVASRHIMPDDFIEGATVVNAPTFIEQFVTANNVLVY
jgi:predicted peroxiredoxin